MKVFKIRHRESGLYWKGGGSNAELWYRDKDPETIEKHILGAYFSKTGKTWNQKNHAGSAITNVRGTKYMGPFILIQCDLVEFELVEIKK